MTHDYLTSEGNIGEAADALVMTDDRNSPELEIARAHSLLAIAQELRTIRLILTAVVEGKK